MISYRRSDSAGITGRIFDRLSARFGADRVFVDVEAIPVGVDFRTHIADAIAAVDVVLAIVGPHWTGPRADGTYRIGDADDPIRAELERAMQTGKRIVPVLVDGALMPPPEQMPASLRDFPFLNAAVVAPGLDFSVHVERLIRQLETGGAPDAGDSYASERAEGNLPKGLSALIGRAHEVEEIVALLASSTLVTISGTGGIGKTRIALEAAHAARVDYADGAWFVDLSLVQDAGLVASELCRALEIDDSAHRSAREAVIHHLKRRCALLLIDNCEHVVDEIAALLESILSTCPQITALATSREPLGLEGERVYRLAPLALPAPGAPVDARSAGAFGAIALFVDRARARTPEFSLTDANAGAVVDVCRRLDGIALAIELAAARIAILTPRQIRDRLAERFDVLTGGRRTALPRQQTLRAAIDWSFDLLSAPERTLFERLAVFAGGWTLDAAEHVCAFGDLKREGILELLSSLEHKSLVSVEFAAEGDDDDRDEPRYRMLESTRAYAREKAAAEWDVLVERLARWCDDFIADVLARHQRHECERWAAEVIGEFDNVRFALEASLASERGNAIAREIVLRLSDATFWYEGGLAAEGRTWLAAALDRVDAAAEPIVAGRMWLGIAACASGRQAQDAATRAVELLTGDTALPYLARAHANLAYAAFQSGRSEEADAKIQLALHLFAKAGNLDGSDYADALSTRGNVLLEFGRLDEAREIYSEAIRIFTRAGDARGAATARGNLAELEFASGDVRRALTLVNDAAAVFRALGLRAREATALVNSTAYRLELEDLDAARSTAYEALRLARGYADEPIVAVALQNVAAVKAFEGERMLAAQLLGVVDAWYASIGFTRQWSEQRISEKIALLIESDAENGESRAMREAGKALAFDDAVSVALTGKREMSSG